MVTKLFGGRWLLAKIIIRGSHIPRKNIPQIVTVDQTVRKLACRQDDSAEGYLEYYAPREPLRGIKSEEYDYKRKTLCGIQSRGIRLSKRDACLKICKY
jgi:hypothetical protein